MSFVGPRPIRPRFFEQLAARAAGVLAAARRASGADRLRAGAARLRDVDGGEARARPRVDRRPLGAPLPAHALADRLARAAPVRARLADPSDYTSSRESSRSRSRWTRCMTSSAIRPSLPQRDDRRCAPPRAARAAARWYGQRALLDARRRRRRRTARGSGRCRNWYAPRSRSAVSARTVPSSISSSSRAIAASAAWMRAFASSFTSSPSSSSPSARITSGSDSPCTTSVASTTQKARKTIRSRARERRARVGRRAGSRAPPRA